jgi:hypothetical protein
MVPTSGPTTTPTSPPTRPPTSPPFRREDHRALRLVLRLHRQQEDRVVSRVGCRRILRLVSRLRRQLVDQPVMRGPTSQLSSLPSSSHCLTHSYPHPGADAGPNPYQVSCLLSRLLSSLAESHAPTLYSLLISL